MQPCASGGFFVTSLLDNHWRQKLEPHEVCPALSGAQLALPDEKGHPPKVVETKEEEEKDEIRQAHLPPELSKPNCQRLATALTTLEKEQLISALTFRKHGKNKITCNTRVVQNLHEVKDPISGAVTKVPHSFLEYECQLVKVTKSRKKRVTSNKLVGSKRSHSDES
jgi:hypothetical protein